MFYVIHFHIFFIVLFRGISLLYSAFISLSLSIITTFVQPGDCKFLGITEKFDFLSPQSNLLRVYVTINVYIHRLKRSDREK